MKEICQFVLYLILSFTFLGSQISSAQNNPLFSPQDLEILSEKTDLTIVGQKVFYMMFYLKKDIVYAVKSPEGAKYLSQIVLPENPDPTYIEHFPAARNYTFCYNDLRDVSLSVYDVKNAWPEELKVKPTIEELRMANSIEDIYGYYKKYTYSIDGIAPGDTIKIHYEYTIPYGANPFELFFYRVFFHGNIYKKHVSYAVRHESDLVAELTCNNMAGPDTTFVENKQKEYRWELSNLQGCISEAGGRPYIELPHFVLTLQSDQLRYTPENSLEGRYIPWYAFYVSLREKNQAPIFLSMIQHDNSSQFVKLRKFFDQTCDTISNDTLGYQKLMAIHHKIADDFVFHDDIDFFKEIDTRDPRMGDFVEMQKIRDISRFDLPIAIALHLKLNYFTTYVCDKRCGHISPTFLTSMNRSDYLITTLLSNNLPQYHLPKRSRFGYYLNELPFYYEKATALLVCLGDYNVRKEAINEKLRFIELPSSNHIDNYRKTTSMVIVDGKSGTCEFKTRVNLSGQFSTLSRGSYLYGDCDPSINPKYCTKIWEMKNLTGKVNSQTEVKSKEFPFRTDVNASYSSTGDVYMSGDTLIITPSNWFNYVTMTGLNAENRQLNFFPDFFGTDTYVYMIKLDAPVKLVDPTSFIELKSGSTEFLFKITQPDPESLRIETFFALVDNIKAENVVILKEIFDAMDKINQMKIKLVKI